MKYWIEKLKDNNGAAYWILFTHGNFHQPTAVIEDSNMQLLINLVRPSSSTAIDDLGSEVKTYRRREKITQTEFAERVGISRTYLSMVESGKATNISLQIFDTIKAAIGK